MTTDEDGPGENEWRVRHLADIQVIVSRLSQHSFIIRGWSVTLVSVLFAILSNRSRQSWGMILFALGATLIFWTLDAFYLRRERLFRHLYHAAAARLTQREATVDVRPFDMDVRKFENQVPGFAATLFTGHVVAIPAMLTTLILAYGLMS